jgi:hypothetical protein
MARENPSFAFTPKEKRSDDWQTPPHALQPLLPYLKKDWLIWEPCAGKGNLVKALRDEGFMVYASDIKTRKNFLKEPHGKAADEWAFILRAYGAIVTNPPYSKKLEFLERAYELGRPFAFLLPLFTFEGPTRQALFEKHGLEVIFINSRIQYCGPEGKQMGFSSAWFTWKLNIGRDITWGRVETPRRRSREQELP